MIHEDINIFNFKQLSNRLAIGGQPQNGQFQQLREQGYDAIIQIDVLEAHYETSNEAFHARINCLDYNHMQMSFTMPSIENVAEFHKLMQQHEGKKVYVHCAAGFCSSLLMVLYQVLQHNIDFETAIQSYTVDNWHIQPQWEALLTSQMLTQPYSV